MTAVRAGGKCAYCGVGPVTDRRKRCRVCKPYDTVRGSSCGKPTSLTAKSVGDEYVCPGLLNRHGRCTLEGYHAEVFAKRERLSPAVRSVVVVGDGRRAANVA